MLTQDDLVVDDAEMPPKDHDLTPQHVAVRLAQGTVELQRAPVVATELAVVAVAARLQVNV